MAKAKWKYAIVGCAVAVAVAAVGVGMALRADQVGNGLAVHAAQSSKASVIWDAAQAFIDTPVRAGTLQESALEDGVWVDHFAVRAVVDGQRGQLIIARDFGRSEDSDVATLIAGPLLAIQTMTIGFKPLQEGADWYWARFDADGEVMRGLDGQAVAARFSGTADGECIAQAWTATTPSG